MQSHNDTIFALSSGQGKSGVAVIRVSGNNLAFLSKPLKPRTATLINFYDIDNLIAIYFKAPFSFTGEDVVELHSHGSIAVIKAIFEKLKSFGFRMAEPGEFSKRAFDNGKMNLLEVDSMRELIDSKTESQRKRALKSLIGGSDIYIDFRNQMIKLSALVAARMDYASDDLPKNIDDQIKNKTSDLIFNLETVLNSKSHIIESGFNIVITGKTNVGKSSLFNRILGESRAIVSDIHGTTRDVISAELDIDGFLVRLIDTAGLRESNDEIEKIGIEKTREQIKNSDLILHIYNSRDDILPALDNEIIVINKSDLINKDSTGILVSAKTGSGIDNLMNIIKEKIHKVLDSAENDILISGRMKGYLENSILELEKSENAIPELQAEHINNAANEIGLALGIIDAAEIYDSVFGQLCLGK